MHASKSSRRHYLDHMRGLVIVFVILQHAVQGYAQQWGGRFWFVDLPDRSHFFDAIFMWTDGFIMQALFFVAGIFVFPSLQRRGLSSFSKEKFTRIFLPMLGGIVLLVSPVQYIKYEMNEEPGIGFFEYLFQIFLTPQGIKASGFWFLAVLLLFTFGIILIDKVLPFVTRLLARFCSWLRAHPILGYLTVGSLVALMITYSDLMYGTVWWKGLNTALGINRTNWLGGFLGLFVARANMMYSFLFFFLMGVGLSKSGLLDDRDAMKRASDKWLIWVILTAALSIAYLTFIHMYRFDGAFNENVHRAYYFDESWGQIWPLIWAEGSLVAVRTVLHGFLCTAQIITLMLILHRFTNDKMGAWASLGACSYGIYFLHEVIVVYTQYALMDVGIPLYFKVLIVFSLSLTISWLTTKYILRRAPILSKVF